MNKKWLNFLLCIAVGTIIWFSSVPMGIDPKAWHLLAIFIATILGFILQPFPIGIVTFLALTLSVLFGVLKPAQALSGFSSTVVWLIISAFLFSRGFIKSGLGRRIAFLLMNKFGDSSLKLAYTLVFSNLIISPAIPSNTARCGGIMYPIVKSLATAFGSEPGPTAKKIGAYLIQSVYQGDNVACSITMTAMAGNLLMVSLASQVAGVELSWGVWFAAGILPGMLSTLMIPLLLYKIFPPELQKTPEAKALSIKELLAMGPMRAEEKILAAVFGLAILGWATSSITHIDATIVAMAAVCIMLLSGIINWSDVQSEKGAWDAMIWMGGIFALAENLGQLGIIKVLASHVSEILVGVPWTTALIVVFIIYIYSTYAFASGVAHIAAMYPAFLTVAVSAGAPPYLAAILLAFASGLYQGLTHYASGPSAIFFASGYIDQRTWWKLGFIVLFFNLLIWGGIGSVWWKIIGLW
jgi:divalent anion:Na+ symporter, DASS family